MSSASGRSGDLWERYRNRLVECPAIGVELDLSRVDFPEGFETAMAPAVHAALARMAEIERGVKANPDEGRSVGHYWLRSPELCPDAAVRAEIESAIRRVEDFASRVHGGEVRGTDGPFANLLVVGIGGSALGPQLVADALGCGRQDRMRLYFLDNTDPDGMERVFEALSGKLGRTLTVVISKSGATAETRNGMLEAAAVWKAAGLSFARHAVAVTGESGALAEEARRSGWLAMFPMWDWVGGRTSVTSAVGLLPAALQGIPIREFLAGARLADQATRSTDAARNPAVGLAMAWYVLTEGRGSKAMVVLPYKDRLALLSRYLQQLVMESLGKERDLDGRVVHQGLTVYGNKGSTDQHAYVQQLRDGVANFFAVFVEVLKERSGAALEVEKGVTSGDYLHGFLLGTRQALYDKGRQSVTLTLDEVSPGSLGALIALFERTVGLYAELIRINAYHQPGVEAGKKAAAAVLEVQRRSVSFLAGVAPRALTADEVAAGAGLPESAEVIYQVFRRLAANGRSVRRVDGAGVRSRFAAK